MIRKKEKYVRFISSKYRTLFYIKDGGTLGKEEPNGIKVEYGKVEYVDDYHFYWSKGRYSLWHICEFAEYMENRGIKLCPFNELEAIYEK